MDKGLKRTRRRKAAKVKVLRRRAAIRKSAKAERKKFSSGTLTRDEQIRMAKLNLAKLETLQAEHDDYKKLREERSKAEIAAEIDASCISPTEGGK